ncbi:cytochrome c oxidase assembly protein [Salicibibacter halophilus]|uniref:Cytochrome c oxidase assembly protein n=1 Tax=Salicibibacter halophilus TaxID=2502791 RepID=A0A514LGX7_9BACI|nr:cytochrome c oxidase assembly protein [Salicibibacter halophilus]QDI90795.1 cytochrome c oxidase assembly protein [Salicibibacter halophilus]
MVIFSAVSAVIVYTWIGIRTSQKKRLRKWPYNRYGCWALGVVSMFLAFTLQMHGHSDFTMHMVVHLLLGMLAPLLFVLAAPVTLLLRFLPVTLARIATKFFKLRPVQFLTHPVVAAIVNFGGLWILYRTSLFEWMHMSTPLSILIHIHVFVAGFVFTSAMLYIDPVPHRSSFQLRAMVMVFGFTVHAVLAKLIYAESLSGVAAADARKGAILMYYGGDIVDALLISVFCLFWYRNSVFSKEKIPSEGVRE